MCYDIPLYNQWRMVLASIPSVVIFMSIIPQQRVLVACHGPDGLLDGKEPGTAS